MSVGDADELMSSTVYFQGSQVSRGTNDLTNTGRIKTGATRIGCGHKRSFKEGKRERIKVYSFIRIFQTTSIVCTQSAK